MELILFREALQAFNDRRELHCLNAVKELFKIQPYHIGAFNILFNVPGRFRIFEGHEISDVAVRALEADPENTHWRCGIATIYENIGDIEKAIAVFEEIKSIEPDNFLSNFGLGRIAQKKSQLDMAEYYYRQALHKERRAPNILNNLGVILNQMGRKEEAEHHFRIGLAQNPNDLNCLINWCRMEESKGNMDKAWKLFEFARKNSNMDASLEITEAALYRRSKNYKLAIAKLDEVEIEAINPKDMPLFWFERSQTLDKMGLYSQAFECALKANEFKRNELGATYDEVGRNKIFKELTSFFVKKNLNKTSPAERQTTSEEAPIFICGFTRSGTSMIEQILSAHPNICGGDELPFIYDLAVNSSNLLQTAEPYPKCLIAQREDAKFSSCQILKEQYLNRLRLTSILEPGARRFTDKMPMNEMHLGLIHLMFPSAKIVHVFRHPLDSVLSSFFTDANHGGNCTYDLKSCAWHYRRLFEITEHYMKKLNLSYKRIHYEGFVDNIQREVKSLLKFVEEPFHSDCVEFHSNPRYSRTASYSQVKEKLYTSSKYRYLNYVEELDEIIPILNPVIKKLGYSI